MGGMGKPTPPMGMGAMAAMGGMPPAPATMGGMGKPTPPMGGMTKPMGGMPPAPVGMGAMAAMGGMPPAPATMGGMAKPMGMKKGGKVGGRGDGVATKGKTKGRMC